MCLGYNRSDNLTDFFKEKVHSIHNSPFSSQYYTWGDIMKKYICPCGYVYDESLGDPDHGVAPGTKWEDVPEDWLCPTCGIGKDMFVEE